ncbi:two-component response regulator ARR5-like [Pyrus ussuriensis x Pyrus communis]|uniref:Two-component response regulator ARR5-like n=1 Tax=Pyrus ussuriensis x Pyrus communis TaxID=2448454 RepID=A0A5N5I0J6_9ROSA|nr:two-component response regulator ARR5-like [Pyrus ussuriensis x Pyrus communis]
MEVVVKSDVADPKQQQQQLLQNQHFHVLAVDDSLLDRKLLERLLRGSSYEVTCVDSGDEALKYLGLLEDLNRSTATSSSSSSPQSSDVPEGSKAINLIMTDFCMPGMSGYDLLKRVKGSSWKDVPVVVMSSENVPSRISMCLEEGAEEFLLKPLQLSDLKKLRPYLLKSLQHYYSNHNEAGGENDQNDQNAQTKGTTEMNHVKGTTINSNSISKRKAQTISERSRPKMKGLGALGPNNIRDIKAQDEGIRCSRPKQYQRHQGPR